MRRKYQVYGLLAVLAVLLGAGVWLAVRYRFPGLSFKPGQPDSGEFVTPPKKNISDLPIRKMILVDNSEVIWEVRGIIKLAFVEDEHLLSGSIVMMDDRNGVEIPVYAGSMDGQLAWGEYEGELGKSNVSWYQKSQAEVTDRLVAGVPVVVRIHWLASMDENLEHLHRLEKLWDAAIDSYADGTVAVDADGKKWQSGDGVYPEWPGEVCRRVKLPRLV